jgi:hypothetical protein
MLFRHDAGWRAFGLQKLKDLGIWPNQLQHNASTGEGVLVVQQSPTYKEYALSEAGFNYLFAAVKEERIAAGFVALVDRRGREVARKPVSEVATQLENVTPKQGRLGWYWWMNADLTPYGVLFPAADDDAVLF